MFFYDRNFFSFLFLFFNYAIPIYFGRCIYQSILIRAFWLVVGFNKLIWILNINNTQLFEHVRDKLKIERFKRQQISIKVGLHRSVTSLHIIRPRVCQRVRIDLRKICWKDIWVILFKILPLPPSKMLVTKYIRNIYFHHFYFN